VTHSQEMKKPLAYHFAKDPAMGTSMCGVPGMIGTLDNPDYPVTCERCKRHPAYLAAVKVAARYAGAGVLK
jgi:hypothetical protein